MSKVLIVDDDRNLLELLGFALSTDGHEPVKVDSATGAIDAWRAARPDLVVLDVNLPDGDGFDICRDARAAGLTSPVIMLTARTKEEDMAQGFAVGADDYVTKPFSPKLFLARVSAILRRSGPLGSEAPALEELSVGDMELEPQSNEFVRRDRRVRLTPTEFRILHLLLSNRNLVLASDVIIERVWGRDDGAEGGSLKAHIRHIREKVEINPSMPVLIVTVPGVGYMARAPQA